jgi:hypothetical protein
LIFIKKYDIIFIESEREISIGGTEQWT